MVKQQQGNYVIIGKILKHYQMIVMSRFLSKQKIQNVKCDNNMVSPNYINNKPSTNAN